MTMTRVAILLLVLAGGLTSAPIPVPAQGEAQRSAPPPVVLRRSARDTTYLCITCHAENRDAFVQGVHSARGIRCHDCHGGNPRADISIIQMIPPRGNCPKL